MFLTWYIVWLILEIIWIFIKKTLECCFLLFTKNKQTTNSNSCIVLWLFYLHTFLIHIKTSSWPSLSCVLLYYLFILCWRIRSLRMTNVFCRHVHSECDPIIESAMLQSVREGATVDYICRVCRDSEPAVS